MSTLAEKKALRLKFMNAIYEKSDADKNVLVDPSEIAKEMGLEPPPHEWCETEDSREFAKVVDYLLAERLIKNFSSELYFGTRYQITHKGIIEVEEALQHPDQPTKYFVPAGTVINYIETAIHSPIQQSGTGSTLSMTVIDASSRHPIEDFIEALKDDLDNLDLSNKEKQNVEAQVKTVDAQLSSPSPDRNIIGIVLQTLKRILEATATNTASTATRDLIIQHLHKLQYILSSFLS